VGFQFRGSAAHCCFVWRRLAAVVFWLSWLCFICVIGNVLLCIIVFFAIVCIAGDADARLFFPDLPADTWQLHDNCVSGFLGPPREALNSRSASTKVSSDSFRSTLCRYLRSNRSFIKDVKQDRRRKSVSNASVEVAHKRRIASKRLCVGEEVPPRIGWLFMGQLGPILI
jgi:hypothetical protein